MADRIHEITSPINDPDLVLRQLTGYESLGRPFEYTVEMYHPKSTLAADDFLGSPLTVSVYSTETKEKRFFNGLVSSFCYMGDSGREHVYRAVLRPWLWFLTRASDCRIFQNLDIKAILDKVFKTKHNFSDYDLKKLKATYLKYEYCVQYRESDFDFVSRLMEREGIYYYFEHALGKHTLVLCEAPASHDPIPGDAKLPFRVTGEGQLESECVQGWVRTSSVQTSKVQLRDFDFEKPKANLDVRSNITRKHKLVAFENYDYPGDYLLTKDGDTYAKVRIEEAQALQTHSYGAAKSYRMAPGYKFTLTEYPRAADNIEYLVVSSQYEVVSGEVGFLASDSQNKFDVQFTAIDAKEKYRPPRVTPKPRIAGPQTAIVVGKSGEEIWTDKYGRVKVQFHWDREGKKDDQSSCWIRVAQLWAGATWGGMHIPRVGQEVVVEFLEGDPDRPLITGRVYNTDQMPPYTLPANATQSGVKSRTSKDGQAANFNELRFEDKKGSEQVYFHAEKDMERIVENNDIQKIGFDKKDKGDQTIEVYNNQTLKVGASGASDGSQTIEIWKNRTETVKTGNETIKIETGNRSVEIQKGNDSLTVSLGNLTIDVKAGKCSITAAQSIELKVGGSSIKLDPMSITLQATKITSKANLLQDVQGLVTKINGSAIVNMQGGIIKIN